MFKIGDKIHYPGYGLSVVRKISNVETFGKIKYYYEIETQSGIKLMVLVSLSETLGLKKGLLKR